LWDWLFGRAIAEPENPNVIRPGEQCLDGGSCPICDGKGHKHGIVCEVCKGIGRILIYLTPDGLNIDEECLEEWKQTSKSSRDVEIEITGKKFRRWVYLQIPAYLKALNLTKCRLRVYHSRGDYTNNEPHWYEHFIEFTQQEIDEVWEQIQNNAQALILEMANGR